ncbi:MAG: DUF2065 domain-containing protein [Azoarcus sp.]|jgi:uncharacterized protein YjeT (DUF2065 family)|nr:DUF2065 domain-containing protein [Azoarcus sp.]
MLITLLTAIALVLIFEGLFPFIAPGLWRAMFAQLIQLRNGQVRYLGLSALMGGFVLLFLLSIWG